VVENILEGKTQQSEESMINRRIAENEDNTVKAVAKTVFCAILTGIGLSIGLYIVRKKLK